MDLTIVTPTYNRRHKISDLYKSLQSQTLLDFEWIIIDDGSEDNTSEIVKQWIENSEFRIRYFYKENGGKHTAINYALKIIETELTFIVDSDDILTEDAVETILRYHNRYSEEQQLCGYSFLRAYPDGKINGKEFTPNELVASYIETRVNKDDTFADKAEVFKTKCLKEFPLPEFQGEKFLGEDIVWIRMAREYMMVHINRAIYIGNYQEDGLTKNRRKNNIKSPCGCMHRAREFMLPDIKRKHRIKAGLQYVIYGKFANINVIKLVKDSPNKKLAVVCFIPGLILHKIWKQKFSNVN